MQPLQSKTTEIPLALPTVLQGLPSASIGLPGIGVDAHNVKPPGT